jgi:uncharacterized protein
MPLTLEKTRIITKIRIRPECQTAFVDWQANFHAAIATFPGFVSLEILSPSEPEQPDWLIVQRFSTEENFFAWHESKERSILFEELKPFLPINDVDAIREIEVGPLDAHGGITEVFVTQVSPDKENIYRKWTAKIHQAEAKFPGFRGVFVQAPQGKSQNWMTFLQFDTAENLDRWLSSPERQHVLNDANSLITSIESHRMISSFAGWFSSVSKAGVIPPVWKQTMIVLLVLFPIVMFELRYLSPWTSTLNSSVGTFIGNAISVTLISWPMMPIAIWFLGWWLSPEPTKHLRATITGTCVVIVLYFLEIAILWNFL